ARPAYEFSQSREFAAVLKCESFLVRAKLISRIGVFLEKKGQGKIQLSSASSGELSLICSLIFLSVSVRQNSIVLVDEPENSLHPAWQREYVGKVIAALAYRNVSVIVATHSPLVVSGALVEHSNLVTVHQMTSSGPMRLRLDHESTSSTGIEAILWRAFDVVTPANHFVSEVIVDAMNKFERNLMSKTELTYLVEAMREKSFDRQQEDFFDAVMGLVEKVDKKKENKSQGGV
ncbi:ATP-binding protein, partial [Pseudomonas asplenii]|uniref:ATP-binding protein n=1 Tax=Pseudomonas asplenii TaxID=53407 RepID=UPI00056AA78E